MQESDFIRSAPLHEANQTLDVLYESGQGELFPHGAMPAISGSMEAMTDFGLGEEVLYAFPQGLGTLIGFSL